MKKLLFVLIATLTAILYTGCKKDEPTENKVPTCTITSPDNGEEMQQGTTVTISVDADDTDGNITEVRFYVDGSYVGSSSSFPYNYDWNTSGEETGNHTLKATAKDDDGSLTSYEITAFLIYGKTGKVTDIDGNVYITVIIGNQEWMAKDLKTTHYADGTEIQLVEDTTDWGNLGYEYKGMCYYDNSTTNANTYGALYTWAAAMNGAASSNTNPSNVQGVCPSGWHLPSDAEWIELISYLGGTSVAGGKMKEIGTTHWYNPNTGATNESGFMAFAGGTRQGITSSFINLNCFAYFWSATQIDYPEARYYGLSMWSSEISRNANYKGAGYSVRCIKD